MYFITTKRMLEVCFSAHPNIQYRTVFVLIIRDSGCWAGFGSGPRVLGLIRGCQTWSLAIWPKFCCLMEDGLIESYRNWGDRTNIRLRSILSNGNLI